MDSIPPLKDVSPALRTELDGLLVEIKKVMQSDGRKARELLGKARAKIRACEGRETTRLVAEICRLEALSYFYSSHLEKALAGLNEALYGFESVGDMAGQTSVLANQAMIYKALEEYEVALEIYQRALALLREHSFLEGEINTLGNLGILLFQMGEKERAEPYLQAALKHWCQSDNEPMIAIWSANCGELLMAQGRLLEAQSHFEKALTLAKHLKDNFLQIDILKNLGTLESRLRRREAAFDFWRQAMTLAYQMEDFPTVARLHLSMAEAEYTEAQRDHLETALKVARDVKLREVEAHALNLLSQFYKKGGDFELALESYKESAKISLEESRRLQEKRFQNRRVAVEAELHQRQLQWEKSQNEILRDEIARRATADAKVKELQECLLTSHRHLKQILAMVSIKVRNALNSILGSTEILFLENVAGDAWDAIEILRESGNHLAESMPIFLQLAEWEEVSPQVNKETQPLGSFLRRIQEHLMDQSSETSCQVDLLLGDQLKAMTNRAEREGLWVEIDHASLDRLCSSLLKGIGEVQDSVHLEIQLRGSQLVFILTADWTSKAQWMLSECLNLPFWQALETYSDSVPSLHVLTARRRAELFGLSLNWNLGDESTKSRLELVLPLKVEASAEKVSSSAMF
jgi:tetratricopeptide (TPR) repeat protein